MISWFEIPVLNIHRAMDFYGKFLDANINFQDAGDFKMAILGGQQGALIQHVAYKPGYIGVLVYIRCHLPIQEQLELAVQLGGKILRPAALISEDFGYTGIIEDCEGNRIGLHGRN
ncbi:MAG: VOC family protein [Bacteroidota bacterium]|nr:VOC family protein [Bacteroidota bacterium]